MSDLQLIASMRHACVPRKATDGLWTMQSMGPVVIVAEPNVSMVESLTQRESATRRISASWSNERSALFRNSGPPEAFIERIGNTRGFERVVHVELDVSAGPGDGEIRNQFK